MRKALLTLGPSTGGIGRHVRDLALFLTGDGAEEAWAVTVAGPADLGHGWMRDFTGDSDGGTGPRFVHVDVPGRWGNARRAYRELARLAADAQIVHAHGLRPGLVTCAVGRRHGVPVVVTVHNRANVYRRERTLVLPPLSERLVAAGASAVIAASPDLARALGRKARMIPVPTQVPPARRERDDVRRGLGIGSAETLVLAVARLHPQKRLQDLAEAALRLPADVRVFVAGEGPARAELEGSQAVQACRLELLGHRDDIPDLVAACDVAVLCSAWEAIPLFLREAAAAAKPLVGTDTGGIPCLVESGVTGVLVPVGDVHALADALTRLAEDPAARTRLGRGARARFEADFSPHATFPRIEALYREVLA